MMHSDLIQETKRFDFIQDDKTVSITVKQLTVNQIIKVIDLAKEEIRTARRKLFEEQAQAIADKTERMQFRLECAKANNSFTNDELQAGLATDAPIKMALKLATDNGLKDVDFEANALQILEAYRFAIEKPEDKSVTEDGKSGEEQADKFCG